MISFSGAQIDPDRYEWRGVVPLGSKGSQFPPIPERHCIFNQTHSPLHGHAIPMLTLTPLPIASLATSIPLHWLDIFSKPQLHGDVAGTTPLLFKLLLLSRASLI
jgi:hypothetical protein